MVREDTHGQMEGDMKVNTTIIRNMVLANFIGKMAIVTKVPG